MPTPSTLRHDNRDVLYALVSPLYERIARLVPRAVSPNQLTLLGLGCCVAACAVLVGWAHPLAGLAAAALVVGYELCDSLDGKHARNTGQSSRFGAYFDTSIDGLAAGLLYTGAIAHYGLYSPLFLLALTFRMAKACLVYAAAAETGARLNPEFGTTAENYLFAGLLAASAFWPVGLDLAAWAGPDSPLALFLASQKLATLNAVQAGLLFALVFLPVSGVFDMLAFKRELDASETPAAPDEARSA